MEVGGGLSVHTWITLIILTNIVNMRLNVFVLTHLEQSSRASDGDQSVSEI